MPHRLRTAFSRPSPGSGLVREPPCGTVACLGNRLGQGREVAGGLWSPSRPSGFCETGRCHLTDCELLGRLCHQSHVVLVIETRLPIRLAFGSWPLSSSRGSDMEREAFCEGSGHEKPGGHQPPEIPWRRRPPPPWRPWSWRFADAPHSHGLGGQMVSVCCTLGRGRDPRDEGLLST